ncbi:hypothetical protein ACP179_03295 [Xenorhabdus stockiae]
MKTTNPKRMQIQWWSAPLAVLLSVALFFVLDTLVYLMNLMALFGRF